MIKWLKKLFNTEVVPELEVKVSTPREFRLLRNTLELTYAAIADNSEFSAAFLHRLETGKNVGYTKVRKLTKYYEKYRKG